MKKTMTLVLLFICIASFMYAGNSRIALNKSETKLEIDESSYYNLDLTFEFSEIFTQEISSEKGSFTSLNIQDGYFIGEIGTPKLPAIKKLIDVPFGADVTVEVLDYTINEYSLSDYNISNKIMPVQPSYPKNVNPSNVHFEFKENAYTNNDYNELDIATVEVLGTLRQNRIGKLVVSPVRYNPVKQMLKVYNNIKVRVTFQHPDIDQTEYIKAATYSPYFQVINDRLLNGRDHGYPTHPDLITYPVKYLIVVDRMFETSLEDFIEWKTQKGFEVIVGYTDVIGSSVSAIKTWIHDQYDAGTPTDPAPSFVLIVGDTGQVPAETGSSSNKATDLYYCSVDGDMFPEMYYGRFSATSPAQLESQIEKTIYYESYQFADPSFLDNVTLIAGYDGSGHNPTHAQPTINYGTENYFNTAHGFNNVHVYLTSYTGCYDTIDDGVCMINYTAHGSQTSWSNPSMTQSMVNALTNVGMYPLAVGNCCSSGDFGYSECFGETWARATNGSTGDPTGSIGFLSSAPSSYWDEDEYWSVGSFSNSGGGPTPPTYEETSWGAYDAPYRSDYVCQDALSFVGNLAVTEADNSGYTMNVTPLYYWQAYNLLGDPSVVVYLTQGQTNSVSFSGLLPIGSTSFTVQAEPGSYVAISMNGVLHGAALADELGYAEVTIVPFTTAGTADIIVTKPQYKPVITTVLVATPAVVNINPASITINALTNVTMDIYEDNGTTPIPNVNILVTGPGVYGTVSGITNASGSCTLNFGGEYGGASILNIIGWRTGDGYNLFDEPFGITGGSDITNPAIWITSSFGLQDTFGLNLPGTVHFSQDQTECTYGIYVVNEDTSYYSTTNEITYTPSSLTEIQAGIMKSGYNMYQEIFTTIEVFGSVSGIVTDVDNSLPVANANVRFYNHGDDPTGDPLFSDETDGLGFYEITTEYPVDSYDIYIDKWGFDPYVETTFFLNYGENSHDIAVTPVESSFVFGYFIGESSSITTGSLSFYRSDNGEEYATIDVVDGYFEISIPNFTYDVYASSPQRVPYSGRLTVEHDMGIKYHLANAIIFTDFENNDGNFVSNDTDGWQWGVPSGGNISAHSGTHCWATVIDGYYGEDYADWTLDSPAFSISGSGHLTFWHYYDFESGYSMYDGGNVSISTDDGDSFTLITPIGGYDGNISALSQQGYGDTSGTWVQAEFDISGFTGENAILRWHFASDVSQHDYWGWYIDDVLYGDPNASWQEIYVDVDPENPTIKTLLNQNFPNPVIDNTTISFSLPVSASKAELKIYNIRGQLVQSFKPDIANGPAHEVHWDGKDMSNKKVANGIYFYRLTTDNKELTKKMIILR